MAVRKESVRLDLEGNFATQAARNAAAITLLNQRVKSLSGEAVGATRSTDGLGDSIDGTAKSARSGSVDIDRYSGRLRLLTQVAAILGPTLAPLGATAVPAVTGLAAALGFTAVAGGTVIAAFQGVGEALEAVNKAAIEPTEANLEAARRAMADLSPEARGLVRELRDWIPALKELRDTAAGGLFPGLQEGLDGLEDALPRVERIIDAVSTELGDIAADAGEYLGGERWAEFLDFLATDTPPALADLATATGNIAHAMGELWMTFDPLNDDFLSWLVDATDSLDEWAEGLSQTEGFEDFVAYVRENGPQVADTVGALATALLDIVEAAAPLGGPVLAAIEGIAKAVSAVADSDLGTPILAAITAVSALNVALGITRSLAGRATASLGAVTTAGAAASGAGVVAAGGSGRDRKSPGRRGPRSSPGAATSAVVAAAGLGFLSDVLDDVGTKGKETGKKLYASFEKPKGGVAEFLFGPGNTMQADFDRAVGQLNAGAFGKVGADIDRAFGGSSFTKGLDNINRLDSRLAVLAKRNPAAAFRALDDIVDRTGRSLGDITSVLPKTNAQLRGTAEAAGGAGGLLAQTVIPNFRAYQKVLRGLPDAVVTQVAERGTDLTRRNVQRLAAQYRLTPRQVRTLMGLVGDGATRQKLNAVQEQLRRTDGLKAFPFIGQQGAEQTRGEVRSVFSGVQALGRAKATPRIAQQGAGDALSQMSAVTRGLANLNGRTATTYIRTVRTGVVGVGGSATIGQAVADGGTIRGQRRPYGDKVLTYLAPGEEVISNRHGQADRHRALLKAINAGRLADGGTARAMGAQVARQAADASASRALSHAGSSTQVVNISLKGARVVMDTDLGPMVGTVVDERMSYAAEMDAGLARAGYGGF